MLNLKTVIAALAIAFSSAAYAQETVATTTSTTSSEVKDCPTKCPKFNPYFFATLQVGGTTTAGGGNSLCDYVSPQFGVSAGYMFTKVVGARLNVTGYNAKNHLGSVDSYYSYNYVNSNIDVMINLYQLIAKKANPYFNFYLLAGAGLNYAWNNDEFAAIQSTYGNAITEETSSWGTPGSNRQSIISHSVRAGLMLDFKVSRKFNVGFEGTISNFSDKLNSINSGGSDWMIGGAAYVTYKFGYKKPCKTACPDKK